MFWVICVTIAITQCCTETCSGTSKNKSFCDLEHNTNLGDIDHNELEVYSEVNDVVQKQYSYLPYPPISRTEWLAEANYYKNHDIPFLFSYQLQLEYLNHYLFQGKENFE